MMINDIQLLAEASKWEQVIELLPDKIDDDTDLRVITIAGRAFAALAKSKFDATRLDQSIEYLMIAWKHGDTSSQVFWPLVESMYMLGKQKQSLAVLNSYISNTTNSNESLRASTWISMVYEVLGEYKLAVQSHRAALSGKAQNADDSVKFDSFINGHVAAAYGHFGRGGEWIMNAMLLWNKLPCESKNFDKRFMLMFSMTNNIDLDSKVAKERGVDEILQFFESLSSDVLAIKATEDIELTTQRCAVLTLKYRFYRLLSTTLKAKNALRVAKDIAYDLLRKARASSSKNVNMYRDSAFQSLHNLGMTCRKFDPFEALPLLNDAFQIACLPDEKSQLSCGPTCFWLSATILETGGDKLEALNYLKKVAEDTQWSYGGLCVRPKDEFFNDEAFSRVRDDIEFINVINSFRENASRALPHE